MTATEECVRQRVREAIEAGRDRRFILCPCAGYMESPEPTQTTIRNLLAYLDEGSRCARRVSSSDDTSDGP
jgi:hypothetical protein